MESPVRNVKYLLMLLCLAFNTACDDVSDNEVVRRVYVAAAENAKEFPDFVPGGITIIPLHSRGFFVSRFEEAMYPILVLEAWEKQHPGVIVQRTLVLNPGSFGIVAVKKDCVNVEADSLQACHRTVSAKKN